MEYTINIDVPGKKISQLTDIAELENKQEILDSSYILLTSEEQRKNYKASLRDLNITSEGATILDYDDKIFTSTNNYRNAESQSPKTRLKKRSAEEGDETEQHNEDITEENNEDPIIDTSNDDTELSGSDSSISDGDTDDETSDETLPDGPASGNVVNPTNTNKKYLPDVLRDIKNDLINSSSNNKLYVVKKTNRKTKQKEAGIYVADKKTVKYKKPHKNEETGTTTYTNETTTKVHIRSLNSPLSRVTKKKLYLKNGHTIGINKFKDPNNEPFKFFYINKRKAIYNLFNYIYYNPHITKKRYITLYSKYCLSLVFEHYNHKTDNSNWLTTIRISRYNMVKIDLYALCQKYGQISFIYIDYKENLKKYKDDANWINSSIFCKYKKAVEKSPKDPSTHSQHISFRYIPKVIDKIKDMLNYYIDKITPNDEGKTPHHQFIYFNKYNKHNIPDIYKLDYTKYKNEVLYKPHRMYFADLKPNYEIFKWILDCNKKLYIDYGYVDSTNWYIKIYYKTTSNDETYVNNLILTIIYDNIANKVKINKHFGGYIRRNIVWSLSSKKFYSYGYQYNGYVINYEHLACSNMNKIIYSNINETDDLLELFYKYDMDFKEWIDNHTFEGLEYKKYDEPGDRCNDKINHFKIEDRKRKFSIKYLLLWMWVNNITLYNEQNETENIVISLNNPNNTVIIEQYGYKVLPTGHKKSMFVKSTNSNKIKVTKNMDNTMCIMPY